VDGWAGKKTQHGGLAARQGRTTEMSQLTFAAIPGFADLDPAAIAGDQPLTDDSIQKISANAKFACVRIERIYLGFWKHGDTVPPPISPVDGYQYSQAETQYDYYMYSSQGAGSGFVSGQGAPPPLAPNATGADTVLAGHAYDIDDSSGKVTCWTYYFGNGNQVNTNDGVLKVYAVGQRSSQSSYN
jgi:hypothetical protein